MTLFQDVHYYIFDKNVAKAAEVKGLLEYMIGKSIQFIYGLIILIWQVKAAMKDGGGTREFYLNDTVTHILSDTAIEPDTVRLLDCHVLHVSTCITVTM